MASDISNHTSGGPALPTTHSPKKSIHQRFRTLAALAVATTVLLTGTATAGATSQCGDYSFGFAGTRLLNDGISTSAGPFPISLPAGTYDVTLQSHDDHVAHPGQYEQTAEQFYVVLDSGWVSPPSVDIADDATEAITVHQGQVIGESTAISVHHIGLGGVNSVDVVCVGFTPTVPAEVADEIVDEDAPEPAAEEAPEPATEDPASSLTDPADPLSLMRPVVPAEIEAEVQGHVETAPLLALTGPEHSTIIALLGAVLLGLGSTLVAVERRLQGVKH
jgi:hypothetical protein